MERGPGGHWRRVSAAGGEAAEAVAAANDLRRLIEVDQERIGELGRTAGSALQVHLALQGRPVQTSATLCKATGLSAPTVNRVLEQLSDRNLPGGPIVREVTGKRRGRVFVYDAYLARLSEGAV